MKTIRLHTFIFWWCFTITRWTFWYMLWKWEFLHITFATVFTLIQSFLRLASAQVFFIFNSKDVDLFFRMNLKIGILDKIFLSCASSCVSLSIFNTTTKEMSSLISTSILLKFSYFLSNSNWISASNSISNSSMIQCSSFPL